MNKNYSWQQMIEGQAETHEDDLEGFVCTLSKEEMNRPFYTDYGGNDGIPFYAWTNKRCYFPVCYDGAEWVGSMPRNPSDEQAIHHGGG